MKKNPNKNKNLKGYIDNPPTEESTNKNEVWNIELPNINPSQAAHNPTIGVRVQDHILGFGLHPGQLTSPRRDKWLLRNPQLKSHKQGINERWSEEEYLLGCDECSSNVYSSN